jgi:SAM-dependent methyltransferase
VRVLYVDIDPLVLAHGRALLSNEDTTEVITADIRDVDGLFDNAAVRKLIDPTQPFAVIASGIFHHFSDDQDPYALADAVKARLSPGSLFFISNFLDDDEPRARDMQRAFLEGGLGTGRFRTWDEQRRFFDGLEMVEPGLVYANDWRPDERTPAESPTHTLYAGGIGRKP